MTKNSSEGDHNATLNLWGKQILSWGQSKENGSKKTEESVQRFRIKELGSMLLELNEGIGLRLQMCSFELLHKVTLGKWSFTSLLLWCCDKTLTENNSGKRGCLATGYSLSSRDFRMEEETVGSLAQRNASFWLASPDLFEYLSSVIQPHQPRDGISYDGLDLAASISN